MISQQEQCNGVAGALANPWTKKGTWAKLKKRKPTPKQCLARRRNKMQRMKTQKLLHVARAKQTQERAAESNKPRGNSKCVKARKAMDTYGSEAHTRHRHHLHVPS